MYPYLHIMHVKQPLTNFDVHLYEKRRYYQTRKISLLPGGSFLRNENCRALELIFFPTVVLFISVTFPPTKHLTNKRLNEKLQR